MVSNIETLVCKKIQLRSNTPRIIYKFLINRFNEDEIEKANNPGVEFRTEGFGFGDLVPEQYLDEPIEQRKEYWLPRDSGHILGRYLGEYRSPVFDTICNYLFQNIAVTPDGKVFPCCFVTDENNAFGDLLQDSLENIWNNDKYRYSRSLFIDGKFLGPKISTICCSCNGYKKKKPHRDDNE